MGIRHEIVEYVRNGLNAGHSMDALKEALKEAGWHINDIEESIAHATGVRIPSPFRKKDMGFTEKTTLVLRRPHELFDSVSHDEGYNDALRYYLLISIFTVAANAVLSVVLFTTQMQAFMTSSGFSAGQEALAAGSMMLSAIPAFFAFMYVFSILAIFAGTGILHYIFVRPLGGEGEVHQTFKAVTYSIAPVAIASVLTILVTLPLMFSSSTAEGIFAVLIIDIFIMLPFVTWTTVLEAIGISRLHGVTFSRALIMLSIPWVLVVLFYGIQFIYAAV